MRQIAIILFAFIISTTALCQDKPLSIKVNKADSAKLEQINAELKKYEEPMRQVQLLSAIKETIIESQFNNKGIPIPQRKEYKDGDVLYLNDEKKK